MHTLQNVTSFTISIRKASRLRSTGGKCKQTNLDQCALQSFSQIIIFLTLAHNVVMLSPVYHTQKRDCRYRRGQKKYGRRIYCDLWSRRLLCYRLPTVIQYSIIIFHQLQRNYECSTTTTTLWW